nr:hypothetical protein [Klebsiella pneumoniae]
MIFYDNAFRLRISHTSVYRIHQHLDFFMQERKERSCRTLLKIEIKNYSKKRWISLSEQ